jgi:hypothetical protein
MRPTRHSFSFRSLKVRLALAGALLILASVVMTLVFVLREVGRSTEQIVLDSRKMTRAASPRHCRCGLSACSARCAAWRCR